jgi:uncharacterized membrane protein YhiD involved in acid resistance
MSRPTLSLLAIFFGVLLGSGLLVYLLLERTSERRPPTDAPAATANQNDTTAGAPGPERVQANNRSFFSELFGRDPEAAIPEQGRTEVLAARVLLRFLIAALLATLLAYGRRRSVLVTKRNPFVAQTQILLAVVAAAMMMIVGDSAARAFGIFAAASLVRFRTNIRDPKETTVLLVCLGVGLGAGVGRLDLAIILTLFVLLTLVVLEYFEEAQIFRAMEVCVATRHVDQTNEVIKGIFARHNFEIELRELDREDQEDPMGKIVYLVNLNTSVSTNLLSEEILRADPENIDRVEWDQKKSRTYIYN